MSVWDTEIGSPSAGRLVDTCTPSAQREHGGATRIAWSQDEKLLLVAYSAPTEKFIVWKFQQVEGKLSSVVERLCGSREVIDLSWISSTTECARFVTTDKGGTLSMWSVRGPDGGESVHLDARYTGACVRGLASGGSNPEFFSCLDTNNRLVTLPVPAMADDGGIIEKDMDDAASSYLNFVGTDTVSSISLSQDRKRILLTLETSSRSRELQSWKMDTATREQIFRLEEEVSIEEEPVAGSCGVRAFFGGVKDRFVVCGYCGLLYIFRCSDGARLCCLRHGPVQLSRLQGAAQRAALLRPQLYRPRGGAHSPAAIYLPVSA